MRPKYEPEPNAAGVFEMWERNQEWYDAESARSVTVRMSEMRVVMAEYRRMRAHLSVCKEPKS